MANTLEILCFLKNIDLIDFYGISSCHGLFRKDYRESYVFIYFFSCFFTVFFFLFGIKVILKQIHLKPTVRH